MVCAAAVLQQGTDQKKRKSRLRLLGSKVSITLLSL